MLEPALKELIRERRYLFRGTNTHTFESEKLPNGFYFGRRHNKEGYVTSTTLSVLYAMVNGANSLEKLKPFIGTPPDAKPLLLAIDSLPYINQVRKGLEWHPFSIHEKTGLVHPDEYEILGGISLVDIAIISDLENLGHFSGNITEESFNILKTLWLSDGF